MRQIDPCDVENPLEDCSWQQDKFLRTTNSLRVRGDDKYTRSVQCIVLWLLEEEFLESGKWLRMNMDWDRLGTLIRWIWECHLRLGCGKSEDLCQWVKQSNTLHIWNWSFRRWKCRIDVEDVCEPAGRSQGGSKIHEEFSKFFCAEYFEGTLEEIIVHWQH